MDIGKLDKTELYEKTIEKDAINKHHARIANQIIEKLQGKEKKDFLQALSYVIPYWDKILFSGGEGFLVVNMDLSQKDFYCYHPDCFKSIFKRLEKALPKIALGYGIYEYKLPHKDLIVLNWSKSFKFEGKPSISFYTQVYKKKAWTAQEEVIKMIISVYINVYKCPLKDTAKLFKKVNRITIANRKELEKIEFCRNIKNNLIEKGFIDKYYNPLKPFKAIKEDIYSIHLKKKCLVCGNTFTQRRKDQTVCPTDGCKMKKSRYKRKVIELKTGITRDEVVRILKEKEDKEYKKKKGTRGEFKKIYDMDKLVEVLWKELGL
jgi:hypothetical protein